MLGYIAIGTGVIFVLLIIYYMVKATYYPAAPAPAVSAATPADLAAPVVPSSQTAYIPPSQPIPPISPQPAPAPAPVYVAPPVIPTLAGVYEPVAGSKYSYYNNAGLVKANPISSTGYTLPQCAGSCTSDPTCYAFGYLGGRCYNYPSTVYPLGTAVVPSMLKSVTDGMTLYLRDPANKPPVSSTAGKCGVAGGICAGNTYYGNLCPSKIDKTTCQSIGCCAWTPA